MIAPSPRLESSEERISLCETLDRVLNKGVVVTGELVISVADIDLIYVGLNVLLSSVETAKRTWPDPATVHLTGSEP